MRLTYISRSGIKACDRLLAPEIQTEARDNFGCRKRFVVEEDGGGVVCVAEDNDLNEGVV